MGSNKDGFENEQDIINYINEKKYYNNMSDNIKHFLSFLYCDMDLNNKEFTASKPTGYSKNIKTDIIISTGGVKKYVSIKKGSGNSVHQEPLSSFTASLVDLGIDSEIIDDLKKYHFGDDTLDGTGVKRYHSSKLKNLYSNEIKKINNALNQESILKPLIDRFLFDGYADDVPTVDAIYYGNKEKGIWASREELMDYLLKINRTAKSIVFSNFNYQNWRRNLKFDSKQEKGRYDMQIKWASLEADLLEITKLRGNNDA